MEIIAMKTQITDSGRSIVVSLPNKGQVEFKNVGGFDVQGDFGAALKGLTVRGMSVLIAKLLPSGGGFDCSWDIIHNRVLRTDVHLMDDNGYYDGYAPVQVRFKWNREDLNLSFEAECVGRRWENKYEHWVDYVEDSIYYALEPLESVLRQARQQMYDKAA
jgi:hypothetical protein